MLRRFLGLSVAFAILFASSAGASERLTLGVVPYYAPEKIWTLFSPFVEYLNRETGYALELKLYPGHDALVEAVSKGELSVAFLGPVPFGRAHRKCAIRPLLVARGDDGGPTYRSVVATTDPAVRTLSDLRGKSFGFFKGSTAAHVVPRRMLEEAGLPDGSYRAVCFKGQDKIVDALLKREIAAAGIKASLFEKFRDSGLVPVAESAPLPNFAFCAAPGLPPRIEAKFRSALLALDPLRNAADRKMMKGWDDEIRHGFLPLPSGYIADAEKLAEAFEAIPAR